MKRSLLIGTGLLAALGIGLAPAGAAAAPGDIHTVAGNGDPTFGGDGGPATLASLTLPSQVAPLPHGGFLIADKKNFRIRKVSRTGRITTVAGTGDNGFNRDGIKATKADLSFPTGVAPLKHGAFLIADSGNDRVRRVDRHGIIHTVAGTGHGGYNGDNRPARKARLDYPARVTPTGRGGFLIADFLNNRVRKVTPKGIIKTVAGNGSPASGGDGGRAKRAGISGPATAVPTRDGGILIAEFGDPGGSDSSRIRKVNRRGIIHTVAGTGTDGYNGDNRPAKTAQLNHPCSAMPLRHGGFLIADYENNRIRKVSAAGTITTVAGTGTADFSGDNGPATAAEIDHPTDVVPLRRGGFLIADFFNDRIRKVAG